MSDMNTPQPAAPAEAGAPTMSTPATLTGIFFEPGRTFEALRHRPRFLVAGLVAVLFFMIYYGAFVWRVGSETMARAQIEARSPDASPEEMEQALNIQKNPIVQVITYAAFPVVFAVIFAAGAGLYLLGAMAMGKGMTYKQALAVWVYSTLPPLIISSVLNVLLLFLKSKDDIDPGDANQGLVRANLALLVSGKEHPVLATALGSLDLFQFYGLFLGAIGLRIVGRLSSGAAWGVVLAIWLFGLLVRVAMAAAFGQAY